MQFEWDSDKALRNHLKHGVSFEEAATESAMSQEPEDDDLQPEYDFSHAVRGKYYQRYQEGSNVILLDPDVARSFKDSESVNRALRLLLELAQREVPPPR